MTPFEHLSVLISIILGLGIAHLLAPYWLPAIWTIPIFMAQAFIVTEAIKLAG